MVRKSSFIYRVYDLYVDGFRRMTLGKTLWAVILIKLFIIFVILKWLFFPDFIKQNAPKGEESNFVSKEILNRTNK
jgi:hypothetical protein